MRIKIIETKRLYMRDIVESDFKEFHEYASTAGFSQFELWEQNIEPYGMQFIQKAISDISKTPRISYDMAVVLKSTDALIGHGHIAQDLQYNKTGNIGYSIHAKFQNQGFATEICHALIHFGVNNLQFSTIYATCDTRNIASIRVLEKSAMKQVSHTIGDREIQGKLYNSFRYETHASELPKI